VITCTCADSHQHVYFIRSCAQLAAEDVHGIVTTGGSYKQGVGTFWLRKRRQLLLRYAENDSRLPLLKYISVAKYSPNVAATESAH